MLNPLPGKHWTFHLEKEECAAARHAGSCCKILVVRDWACQKQGCALSSPDSGAPALSESQTLRQVVACMREDRTV